MTSFSLYATNSMKLTPEGDLPHDEEVREDYVWRITNTIAAGAARTLLDNVTDDSDPDHQVHAEEWHTPAEGWELDALDDTVRPVIVKVAEKLFAECERDVLDFVNDLAWRGKESDRAAWFHDEGRAYYRIGALLAFHLTGEGVGFYDYSYPSADRLSVWMGDSGLAGALDTSVDTSEEPCLLHASMSEAVKSL